MKFFDNKSLGFKVQFIILTGIISVLFLFIVFSMFFYYFTYKNASINNLELQARIISEYIAPAIDFGFTKEVKESVSKLKGYENFVNVKVFDRNKNLIASIERELNTTHELNPSDKLTTNFSGTHFQISLPIESSNRIIGYLIIDAKSDIYENMLIRFIFILFTASIAIAIAFFYSAKIQKIITGPIVTLSNAAKNISMSHDYSIRISHTGSDEIGDLTTEFNEMLVSLSENRKEREKSASVIQASEEKFREVFNNSTDFIHLWSVDTNGLPSHCIDLNTQSKKLQGYDENNFSSLNFTSLVDGEIPPNLFSQSATADSNATFAMRYKSLEGKVIPVEIGMRYFTLAGNPVLLTIARDISSRLKSEEEKQLLEQQLLQSQKLESIGRLAGGIAHDFNNILQSITGFAELLKNKFSGTNTKEEKWSNLIHQSATRGSDLTRRLLGFARQGKFQSIQLNINNEIKEAIAVCEKIFEKHILIKYNLDQKIKLIEGDKNQIHQVLTNIFINARDAMSQGGTLTVTTKNVLFEISSRWITGTVNPGEYVRLDVQDTGSGISNEIIDKIFEPFFTTKETGKGTGLGLSMVYGIVKNHGGFINVSSIPEKGTTFSVLFPISQSQTIEEEIHINTETIISRTGRILLVDDEPSIREYGRSVLTSLGFTITEAANGADAIIQIQNEKEYFVCIILDMIMPVMDGRETFNKIRSINSTIPIIVSSGYSQEGYADEILSQPNVYFLQKPYTLSEMSDLMSKIFPID